MIAAFLEAAAFLVAVAVLGAAAGYVAGETRGIRIGRGREAAEHRCPVPHQTPPYALSDPLAGAYGGQTPQEPTR